MTMTMTMTLAARTRTPIRKDKILYIEKYIYTKIHESALALIPPS